MFRLFVLPITTLILLAATSARGDTFLLASGGQVDGEIVVSPDVPKDKWLIRTPSGGEVTLDKSQVKEHDPHGSAVTEYEKIRPTYSDTVDGQWQLAEWCREHSLAKQRRTHLERIIALDTNHKQARAALDFRFVDGRWVQPDELMKRARLRPLQELLEAAARGRSDRGPSQGGRRRIGLADQSQTLAERD